MEIVVVDYKHLTEQATRLIQLFQDHTFDAIHHIYPTSCALSDNPLKWKYADALILPDSSSLETISAGMYGELSTLKTTIEENNPHVLGIGSGMHLLTDGFKNNPTVRGLGVVAGSIRKFSSSPHRKWNKVTVKHSQLFDGLDGFDAYFDHDYYCKPYDPAVVVASAKYNLVFPAAIARDNIFGVQFSPEKSGDAGLTVLKNFLQLVKC